MLLLVLGTGAAASALDGNATPTLDAIAAGEVAVVAFSAPVRDRVAFVVQNGTDQPVRVAKVVAVAALPDGTRATRASTTDVIPTRLAPAETAIGQVRFRRGTLTPDAVITWKVTATRTPSADDPVLLVASGFALSPPQSGRVAQTLDLDVRNPHTNTLVGPILVKVLCLNEASKPALLASSEHARKGLKRGATAHVTVELRELCPSFVVGARANLDR